MPALPAKLLVTLSAGVLLTGAAPRTGDGLADWSAYSDRIAGLVGGAIGREVSIGAIQVNTALPPTLVLRDVTIANADWGSAKHLVELVELRLQARIGELLSGEVVIPEVAVSGLRLNLARNAEGMANWTFGASQDTGPTELPLAPVVENLRVSDARVGYTDAALDLDLTAVLASLTGRATAAGVHLSGEGRLAGEPLRLVLDGAALDRLDAAEQPYPLRIEVGVGDTELAADGTITNPLAFAGANVAFTMRGADLATLGLGAFPVPRTPPYRVEARLEGSGDRWRLDDARVDLGETRALGWAEVNLAQEMPELRADVLIPQLRYEDLLPAQEEAAAPDAAGSGGLFPDQPLPIDWLEQGHGVVHVRIEENDLPVVPVRVIDARLILRDGRLEVSPLTIGAAGGEITGEAALNGREATPSADLDLAFDGLQLKETLRGTRFVDETAGTVHGNLYLLGVGRTVRELMASLRGHVAVVMSDGTISGLIVEGIGLDVAEALALYIGEDTPVGVNCAVVGIEVDGGVADIRRLVIGTTDSVIRGDGRIDLGAEQLNLRFEAQGKDFSILDLDAPVFIQGSLSDPGFSVGKTALIPLIELGLQGDVPCQRLEEEVLSLGGAPASD